MISESRGIFRLSTNHSDYLFRVTKFGHLEHIYYGDRLREDSIDPLLLKHTIGFGSSVNYDVSDDLYCLDTMTLEYSGIGKGDFRHPPLEIQMPDGTYVSDFKVEGHRIFNGFYASDALPTAYGTEKDCQTLEVRLKDAVSSVLLNLYYTVFEETDVITRRAILRNLEARPLRIRKLMSLMLDLPGRDHRMITLDGAWIREANRNSRDLVSGMVVNESLTGASSNRHNPAFLICEKNTTETHGDAYGFNLVYSGNHYSAVEVSPTRLLRIMTGINPHCFEWPLAQGEQFETPEAAMTFSSKGLNGISQAFHAWINRHIVRGSWKMRERPVVLNSWEAFTFDFTRKKLLHLAKQAAALGVEYFVLDDGWFGARNNDRAGLGDYEVNLKKLPGGLSPLAKEIEQLGMKFGLWFEPEMVNEDSDLYRSHPEYAVKLHDRTPSLGRNQLVLDLCNPEVQDYIITSMRRVLDSAAISYVKWDMNRSMSDMYSAALGTQGEFYHRYILGLYRILREVFTSHPEILVESCSSGGNRFDLGMLCYAPQVWASDNTDPIERLKIQAGLSLFYPPSTISAHVSMAPHQQTLRDTPLSTRFNVACFGVLGYELDLDVLTDVEKREIRKQITFYKSIRKWMQFGTFYRFDESKPYQVHFLCVDAEKTNALAGSFQTLSQAADSHDRLPLFGLDPSKRYRVQTVPQGLSIKRFGGLVQHISPIRIHPNGFVLRKAGEHYMLPDAIETYEAGGDTLQAGLLLNNQFIGTGYNKQVRLLGDYGSNIYKIEQM